MTLDDIIKLAREAGFEDHSNPELWDCMIAPHNAIARFAALVAAAEREAIAQMVENAPPLAAFANDNGGCVTCGFTPKLAARAIRARGNQ